MQNSIKNSIFALLLRLLNISFPFITRTIIIHSLGLSYVGISGLFTSLFGVLSLAELGVGNALLQALYFPIKNNDKNKINAIICFYKKTYFIIGLAITSIGIIVMPFLKNIIKDGTYPKDLNIYYIYFINLICSVLGYMVYSYKSLLLEAFQKGRESNKVRIVVSLFQYGIQIPILLFTKNYYFFISVLPVFSILTLILIAKVCDRELPGYRAEGKLPKSDIELLGNNISSLFLYKIGSVVNNYVDGIIISIYMGATVLGAYNNYYLIVSSISALVTVVYTAILPSVGHEVLLKSKEENYNKIMESATLDGWFNGWCSICLTCLLSPFIKLWVGEEGFLGDFFALLFGIYFFFWRILDPISMYKDALGLWRKDKWRPLLTACVNLISNIVLVQLIGIYGILLSTILAVLFISFPFSAKVLMNYFEKDVKTYIFVTLKMMTFVFVAGIITWFVCGKIVLRNEYINFFLSGAVCLVLPNILFFVVYGKTPAVRKLLEYIERKVGYGSK